MYFRSASLLSIAALAAVAAAAPSALQARNGSSQCNTGPVQCCNTNYDSTSTALSELAGLLGVVLPSVSGLVGFQCSPLTAVGVGGGSSCAQQPVCCTGNTFSGVLTVGCSPVDVTL